MIPLSDTMLNCLKAARPKVRAKYWHSSAPARIRYETHNDREAMAILTACLGHWQSQISTRSNGGPRVDDDPLVLAVTAAIEAINKGGAWGRHVDAAIEVLRGME